MVDTRHKVRAQGAIFGRFAALAGAASFVLILISAVLRSNAPSSG